MSTVLVLPLIGLAAVEAWLVQARTLQAPQAQGGLDPFYDRAIRLGLDLLLFGAAAGLLPVPLLALLFTANALAYVFLIVYHDYFHQPLSLLVLLNQMREGAQVTDAGFALLRPWHFTFLIALGVKLLLLFGSGGSLPGWRVGLACLALYLLAVAVINRLYKPLGKITTW